MNTLRPITHLLYSWRVSASQKWFWRTFGGSFQPVSVDVLKLDMKLTRNLHLRPRASRLIPSVVDACKDLSVSVVAEGIETTEELRAVQACGIDLVQGYLLGKPAFEELPAFTLPGRNASMKSGDGSTDRSRMLSGRFLSFRGV